MAGNTLRESTARAIGAWVGRAGAVASLGCWLVVRRVVGQSGSNTTGTTNGTAAGAGGGSGSASTLSPAMIVDAIVKALTRFLRTLVTPITTLIEDQGSAVIQLLVHTPHPTRPIGEPVATPWRSLHAYYWETLIPLTLLLFGLAVGVVILLESTSHLFSGYHRRRLKRRALLGLLGVLAWWWLNALALQFADALTAALVPSLGGVTLFETLSFGAIGVLGTLISLSVDLFLFVVLALLYFGRHLVIYLYTLLMPLLFVLWIPALGPFGAISRFATRLASFYVPVLLMPLPVAVLFRLGELLGDSAELSMGGFGAWLAALVVPVVALVAPLVLVWQTGRLMLVGDRVARRVSARQARGRLQGLRARGTTATQAGRNAVRGARGDLARRPDGQLVFEPGATRGHAVGSRVRRALARQRGSDPGGGDTASDRYEPREFRRDDWTVDDAAGRDPGVRDER